MRWKRTEWHPQVYDNPNYSVILNPNLNERSVTGLTEREEEAVMDTPQPVYVIKKCTEKC